MNTNMSLGVLYGNIRLVKIMMSACENIVVTNLQKNKSVFANPYSVFEILQETAVINFTGKVPLLFFPFCGR